MKIIILGGGLVGSAIARDLQEEKDFDVFVADVNQKTLDDLNENYNVRGICADLSDSKAITEIIKEFDLVIGALPGFMGFSSLKTIISEGKNVVDISFFPEDAFELDELAKKKNVVAVVDCGVAPGCSNIILGHISTVLEEIESFRCYVGGLPIIREWPFEYKAPFSPIDVIEEYTRSARYVKDGKLTIKPALSEPELLDFSGVGTLEAFNTDGLRSLLFTFPNIPNMLEKTLRYPGHIEKMKIFREMGFFNTELIDIKKGLKVRPIDLTTKLLFKNWQYQNEDEDLTVMRINIIGKDKIGNKLEYQYDMLDKYDKNSNTLSMARTTGYTCSIVARLVIKGHYNRIGISPPEFIGKNKECYQEIMKELKKRNIDYKEIKKKLK